MRRTALTLIVLTVAASTAGAASSAARNGRVLFTDGYSGAEGYGSLYAINPHGTGRVRITSQGSNGTWSPDGKSILFESSRRGDEDLWLVGANGAGRRSSRR